MSKKSHKATAQVAQIEATTTPAPVAQVEATTTPVAKPKAVRYAPVSTVTNPASVLVEVHPSNPKRPGSISHTLWDQFLANAQGLTVAQVEANFVAGNKTKGRARRFIRWAIAHGHVTLGNPVEA